MPLPYLLILTPRKWNWIVYYIFHQGRRNFTKLSINLVGTNAQFYISSKASGICGEMEIFFQAEDKLSLRMSQFTNRFFPVFFQLRVFYSEPWKKSTYVWIQLILLVPSRGWKPGLNSLSRKLSCDPPFFFSSIPQVVFFQTWESFEFQILPFETGGKPIPS